MLRLGIQEKTLWESAFSEAGMEGSERAGLLLLAMARLVNESFGQSVLSPCCDGGTSGKKTTCPC